VEALPRDACTPEAGFPLPPEPERARAVEATLATLRRASNRCVLEGPRVCRDDIEASLAEARRLDHPPLLAYALQQSGAHEDQRGEAALAESRFEEAFFLTRTAGRDELATKAAVNLVDLVGYRGGRHDEGERWARQAEALLATLPADHHLHGDLLNNLRRALAIGERNLGADHPELDALLANLARVLARQGDPAGARAALERADAILARHRERDHPLREERAAELAALEGGR
jgi:eukaryotic-like serine/threonine-protein kinase